MYIHFVILPINSSMEILFVHFSNARRQFSNSDNSVFIDGDDEDDNNDGDDGGGEANANTIFSLSLSLSLLMSKIEIYTSKRIHMRIGSFKSHIQRVLLPFSLVFFLSIPFYLLFILQNNEWMWLKRNVLSSNSHKMKFI